MSTPHSAGLLLYRLNHAEPEVLLVHPGGPFWQGKDQGAWSIPKGLIGQHESPLSAARREFNEETGFDAAGVFIPLGTLKQPSGKIIHTWALEQDIDTNKIHSNNFMLEWPKGSGIIREFPEIDKGAWFLLQQARCKIISGQTGFLDKLAEKLAD